MLLGAELLSASSSLFFHLLIVATEVLNLVANSKLVKMLFLISLLMCKLVMAFE